MRFIDDSMKRPVVATAAPPVSSGPRGVGGIPVAPVSRSGRDPVAIGCEPRGPAARKPARGRRSSVSQPSDERSQALAVACRPDHRWRVIDRAGGGGLVEEQQDGGGRKTHAGTPLGGSVRARLGLLGAGSCNRLRKTAKKGVGFMRTPGRRARPESRRSSRRRCAGVAGRSRRAAGPRVGRSA